MTCPHENFLLHSSAPALFAPKRLRGVAAFPGIPPPPPPIPSRLLLGSRPHLNILVRVHYPLSVMQGDDPAHDRARQLLDTCSRTITFTRIQAGDGINAFRAETSAFPELPTLRCQPPFLFLILIVNEIARFARDITHRSIINASSLRRPRVAGTFCKEDIIFFFTSRAEVSRVRC